MSDFTFRLRFIIPQATALEIPEALVDLSGSHHPSLSLLANEKGKTIKEAKSLVLKGSGHSSDTEAISTGERLRDALTLALAHCRIGADFGDRTGRGGFTQVGLRMLEDHAGHKLLNDIHGLMAYETNPPPKLASSGQPTLILGTPADKFTDAFARAAGSGYTLTERERLSYSLFSSSFFERSQDARLLFLVMSVEVLLDPQPRPAKVIEHVDALIQLTQNANDLPSSERNSLLSALGWLHCESIRQASRRLISSKISGNTYDNRDAPDFFLECYNLRSALVHGSRPYPTRDMVGTAAANLEVLVADLLSASIIWAIA